MNKSIAELIQDALNAHARQYGYKVTPWYIVLGKQEISRLAMEHEARPRFSFQGDQFKTPNRFYHASGECRIVAVPLQSHFSLGYDPDVANHYDQTTPYWSQK
jgi:hypothetical protein